VRPEAKPSLSVTPTAYLPWLLAVVLIATTVLLRSPTFNDHILFIDEPIYYSFGSRLELPGAHVYTHTADQKPPLGPMTYWLAIQMSPEHAIMVVHALTTAAIAVTTLLLLVSSQLLLGSPWAGFAAGLLYALVSSSKPPVGEAFFAFSSLEHFQAPLLIGFILLFLLSLQRQRWWLAAAAGALLGVAAMYKQNVPVLLGPAWLIAMLAARRRRLPMRAAVLTASATSITTLTLVAAVPLYYAVIGHFDAWRFYNIDVLVLYRGLGGSVVQQAVLLAGVIPLKIPLAVGLFYGALAAPRRSGSHWDAETGLFLATGWLVLFCSLAPGLHKAHYLIQALPAECLLIGMAGAVGWQYVAQAHGTLRPVAGAAYAAVFVLPLACALYELAPGWSALAAYASADGYLALHRRAGTLAPLVRYIQERSGPNDLIYVHSEAPELYFLTQRRPAVSDPTGSWIAMVASPKVADGLLHELQASPPRLIVQLDYRRYGRVGETLQKWPQLASWIYQHYREHTYMAHVQILEWQGGDAWPLPPPDAAEIPLSVLPPETVVQTAGWLRFDRNLAGQPLRIGGHTYQRGIGTHAMSRITYRLDGAYRTFLADAGIDAAVGKRGSVVFTVEVDGTAKFTSPLVTGGTAALPIDVDISGARTLTLVVTPGNAGNAAHWADWASARLTRASP
jgi:hypothetical protein